MTLSLRVADFRIASRTIPAQHPINSKNNAATQLISTKKAMEILGVGSTTIKRWSDNGTLPFMRTAGGHRRFKESDARRLRDSENQEPKSVEEFEQLFHLLLHEEINSIRSHVLQLHDSIGNWFVVSDYLGWVLQRIGAEWRENDVTIVEEGLATNKLAQVVTSISASMALPDNSPKGLLATLSGERHQHGVLLAQLCLRSVGVDGLIAGYDMSSALLKSHISKSNFAMVGLSASSWQSASTILARECLEMEAVCKKRKTALFLGGAGAWPSDVSYGYRCNSYVEFGAVLKQLKFDSPTPSVTH